jgi:SET domain-containing protein
MIHPDTALRFISKEKGFGVIATRLIPKGTITWAFDKLDMVFTKEQIAALEPPYRPTLDKYCYRDNDGKYIFCWDYARFVNHSFRSSCISTAYNFELAVRDILPGEELTDDYGYLNIEEPWEAMPEPGSNRTHVRPDDLLHFHEEWDAQLIDAFRTFNSVEQPLAWLIEERFREKVAEVATGKAAMDSILSCYFDPNKQPT